MNNTEKPSQLDSYIRPIDLDHSVSPASVGVGFSQIAPIILSNARAIASRDIESKAFAQPKAKNAPLPSRIPQISSIILRVKNKASVVPYVCLNPNFVRRRYLMLNLFVCFAW